MGQTAPDVRVRLSATGVSEVVNAFKQVQQEADRSGDHLKNAGSGASFLKDQLKGIASILPQLTVGAAVVGFLALVKGGIESAATMSKVADKTGLAVKTISTLSFAAQEAGADADVMNKGLVRFSKTMGDYDAGSKKVRDSVRQLFGDSKALAGLPLDERFHKVADALGRLEPGAKRTNQIGRAHV